MLQFLQTGRMLYVFGAICMLGMISKLVTSSLYRRLIEETGNMALTKNKNLKALKQKTENLFLISHGIRNASAYIEKQLYGFRFMKISLENWDSFSTQAMILCFLTGGASAFGSYWYRCDSYYIVLYGTVGILSGLFLMLVDNGANIAGKRQQLTDYLIDYVENSPHFYKNVDKSLENINTEKQSRAVVRGLKPGFRESVRVNAGSEAETAAGEETSLAAGREEVEERTSRFHIERPVSQKEKEETGNAQRERQGSKFSVLPRKKEVSKEIDVESKSGNDIRSVTDEGEDELLKSIEQLRQSLDQIAAGREPAKQGIKALRPPEKGAADRAKKELRSEDLKLLGDILKEYLT